MLTATHHSYGSPGLSDFFRSRLWGSDPSTDIHAKWLKQRVFTQGCAFRSKSRYFSCPLISRPPKRSKFCKFLDVEIFRSIWPLTLEVQTEDTPYSSSEPNKSDIENRQSGGEKLKYILKFYIGGTCHVISRMRNDDSALCLLAHGVWGGISRKPLEIETWVQRTTNRKWPIPNQMVMWPMTSRDPQRSRSWPQYIRCPLSRKWLEIATWWQWIICRKWLPGNQMVTWPITSRDSERSRSWPEYVWCPLSRKLLEIATW